MFKKRLINNLKSKKKCVCVLAVSNRDIPLIELADISICNNRYRIIILEDQMN